MKAYLDITLLPSDDIGHHFLWSKVFQQVHLALVENKTPDGSSTIGVTFPEFSEEAHRLGRKLRLFAENQSRLEQLDIMKWLARLRDYVHVTSIRATPEKLEGYVIFTRLRTKTSKERLARRAAKRQGIDYETALQQRSNFQPKLSSAPFIQLKSLGNGHPYRLLITAQKMAEPTANSNGFNSYGLSKGQALPMF